MIKNLSKAILFIACLCTISFTSCSDDDDSIDMPDVTLKAGDTYTIDTGTNWLSANTMIATVTGNTIKAVRVGKTKISNSNASFNLTVTPKYDLYDDPCMKWGASEATVNNYMKGHTMLSQEDDMTIYSGDGVAELYAYFFDDGKLTMSIVALDAERYYQTLHSFLAERYQFLGQDDEDLSLYYISMDGNLAIMVELVEISDVIYAYVSYIPYEGDATNAKSKKLGHKSISTKMGMKPIAEKSKLESFKLQTAQ